MKAAEVCSGPVATDQEAGGSGELGRFFVSATLTSASSAMSLRKALPLPVAAARRDNVDISARLQVAPQCRFLSCWSPAVFIQRAKLCVKPSVGPALEGKKFAIAAPGSGDLFNKQIWLLST